MKASVIRKAKTAKRRKEQGKPYRQFIEVEPDVFRGTDEVIEELEATGKLDDKPDDEYQFPTEL